VFPIEAFEKTLSKVAAILDKLSIRFHLTGGLTTVAYGEPRMTQDLDLVVDPEAIMNQFEEFFAELAISDFLYDEIAIRNAIKDKRGFQLLDTRETLKLDLYPRELIPGELDRSILSDVFSGRQFPVASLADAVISKLIWVSKGSHKNRQDVRRMFLSSNPQEQADIQVLAQQVDLVELLNQLIAEFDNPIE
jgi:hypothetical protein